MVENIEVPAVGEGEININCKNSDIRGRLLSNLTNRPFQMGDQMCASVEGFFAGILYPPGSLGRRIAFASCYGYSQKMVLGGSKTTAWWNGQELKYGSDKHKALLRQGLLECTLQNPDRLKGLLDTEGLVLRHLTGTPEDQNNFLSRAEFCVMMTEIREELLLVERKIDRFCDENSL